MNAIIKEDTQVSTDFDKDFIEYLYYENANFLKLKYN